MTYSPVSYRRHRFPLDIISYAVWLYYRFSVSFRDVEDLLAQRGVTVTYETIRRWCAKFGRAYARRLRRREKRLGDIWHLDEVFVTIGGRRQYLWRGVDQEGAVLGIPVQPRRDARAFGGSCLQAACKPSGIKRARCVHAPAILTLIEPQNPLGSRGFVSHDVQIVVRH